ncbi:DUF1289 domain-containing protein [Motiliproteus sp. MSK22-1]|uniref:DUF1289 domain-containing protein n=1 Tax=Motiliproteus sp. MSK22-1 TaxID=1897630 RepID=UPI000977A968|nr:DUF1289 domain-containing protein [Motiliproteus sp. MSK22-1]OMH32821.1 hypothetical protein BGP75_14975 [Motiliproteus sp. MSK22-1]
MPNNSEDIASPCVRHCCLDGNDTCLGCFRQLSEITGWYEADRSTRLKILEKAAERRKAHEALYSSSYLPSRSDESF